mgnify:FL=1|jgi:hypothetical protein
MEINKKFKEDIQIVKEFDQVINSENWDFYRLEGNSIEDYRDDGDFFVYMFEVFFFKNTFIIQMVIVENDNCEDVKIYFHTENSLSFLFFDEPEVFSDFFNYLDKIKEKQEIKDKIEKIKISQKLNNF